MIRKLQLKFVAVCMTLVMVVLGAVLVSIFLSARQNLEVLSHQVLQRVIREDTSHGTVPSQQPDLGLDIGGKEVVLPYFTVVLWEDRSGNYTAYVTGGTYSNLQGTEELSTVLQECLTQKQEEGTLRTYNLRYLRQDNGLFQKIAFVDTSMQQATLQEMMSSHIQIAVAAFFLLLAISIALARWATAPVEKAWRQQRQFLSDASHELKTPLAAIRLLADSIEQNEGMDEATMREFVSDIGTEADRLQRTTEKLLDLSRRDDGVQAARVPVDLGEVARSTLRLLSPLAEGLGVTLRCEPEQGCIISASEDDVYQIVFNLAENAVKYNVEGGSVDIRVRRGEGRILLDVEDTGIGIPEADLPNIFSRFYRVDKARSREKGGSGLGLSIVHDAVTALGGSITVEHREGGGTRFSVSFPEPGEGARQ